MADTPVWELGNNKWVQDNEKQAFVLVEYNGNMVADYSEAALAALRLSLPMRHHATPGAGGCRCERLPQDFSYCPFCGTTLEDSAASGPAWMPPYGPADGTRVYEALAFSNSAVTDKGVSAIGGVKEFTLPRRSANFNFFVAQLGTPERVLACIDKSGGIIDVYDPTSAQWITLARSGPSIDCSRQPDWSWSAVALEGTTDAALCWPTPEGPVWAAVDLARGATRTIVGTGRGLGGAARLGEQFLVPTDVAGKLVLQRFDRAGQRWLETPVPGVAVDAADYLGVPIVDRLREKIYWIGASGFLTCTLRDTHVLPVWRTWDDRGDCVGLPMYGPPHVDRNNRFWQLCLYTEREASYRYYELGGTVDDFHADVPGEMLSTGRTAFDLLHNFWNDPWDEPIGDRFPQIRIPLLQLGDNNDVATVVTLLVAHDNLLISEMHDRTVGFVNKEAKNLALQLVSRESAPRPFLFDQHVLATKRPWECKAFVYQDGFYLYFPDKSKCYRWPMNQDAV